MPYKDPEKARAAKRRWAEAHPNYWVEYHKKNAKQIQDRVTQWREDNPEKFADNVRQFVGNRRARLLEAPVRDFSGAHWKELLTENDHRCFYCQQRFKRLTQDHIVPLSRGGAHTKSNIVPACKSCNSRKGALTADEFMPQRKAA